MKLKNNKLDFTKNSLIELNEIQLINIDGGTTGPCAAATVFIGSAALSFMMTQIKLKV